MSSQEPFNVCWWPGGSGPAESYLETEIDTNILYYFVLNKNTKHDEYLRFVNIKISDF